MSMWVHPLVPPGELRTAEDESLVGHAGSLIRG